MAEFLNHPVNRRKKLRELLTDAKPVLAPGCHDALSARLVEYAGFDAVYIGGFATTASILGRPDAQLEILAAPRSLP
jgi:2-methylisocitrate lyase-like PEP mutase family enzyme